MSEVKKFGQERTFQILYSTTNKQTAYKNVNRLYNKRLNGDKMFEQRTKIRMMTKQFPKKIKILYKSFLEKKKFRRRSNRDRDLSKNEMWLWSRRNQN